MYLEDENELSSKNYFALNSKDENKPRPKSFWKSCNISVILMAQRWFIFQTENLKYLKSTNFLGFRTTENEIYVKFCLRKSLVARDSIVDILGIKAGRFLRVFSKEAPGKLKNTNRCFSRYIRKIFDAIYLCSDGMDLENIVN